LVALYFGANWAPPCRHFWKKLHPFYKSVNLELNNMLEIVYISDDCSQQLFDKRYKGMTFAAIDFIKADKKTAIK
jgi:hypothetical protein